MAQPSKPCTWFAFFTAGLLFPLHMILGFGILPTLVYFCFHGSYVATFALLTYLPVLFHPAQHRVPGWKSDTFWKWFDVRNSAISYNGEFAVHVTEAFDDQQQYVVGVHPHGTMIFQRLFWLIPDLRQLFKRDYRMLCASVIFKVPVMRELALLFGGVDAGKAMAARVLASGLNLVLYPGGLDEANSVTHPRRVTLRTRTGFIRMAVERGLPVLPMFCFGELDAVSAVPMLPATLAKVLQKKLRISSTAFVGRWYTFIPRRVPFNLVVGRPIRTDKFPEGPALDKEVLRVQAAYKAEVSRIYNANKECFGYADRELVFACDGGSPRAEEYALAGGTGLKAKMG